jgi:hypothetical protein
MTSVEFPASKMRKLILNPVLLLFTIFTGCKGKQVGCICEDGWQSDSMGGPGTCNHHGGVAYKFYESDNEKD